MSIVDDGRNMNDRLGNTVESLAMDERLQAHLGDQLRQLFAEAAAQPIPDRFLRLLDRLEANAKPSDNVPPQALPATASEARP